MASGALHQLLASGRDLWQLVTGILDDLLLASDSGSRVVRPVVALTLQLDSSPGILSLLLHFLVHVVLLRNLLFDLLETGACLNC